MAFQNLQGEETEAPMEPADPLRRSGLSPRDQAMMSLIDRLSYSIEQVSELLNLPAGQVRRRYWKAREKLRPRETLVEGMLRQVPNLLARDLAALKLIECEGYSIGRAARVLGVNKGHLCRRVNAAKELLKSVGDPRIKT